MKIENLPSVVQYWLVVAILRQQMMNGWKHARIIKEA
jgi:hypothetical protein